MHAWIFPATQEVLEQIVDMFPGIILDEQTKVWYQSIVRYNTGQRMASDELNQQITNYNFKTVPYNHQKKAFVWAMNNKSGGIFFECGLGKTKTALDIMNFLYINNQIKRILIVIPLSVASTWIDEIKKHTDITSVEMLLDMSIKKRSKILKETNKEIYIINYDALPDMVADIKAKQFDMIICDESTYLKNHKAKRTKALFALSSCIPRRYVLTGTPLGQRLTDVYAQLKFIRPDIFRESFWSFRNRYCKMGGFGQHQIVGYQNTAELNQRIASVSQLARKEDCLDLPPKIYQVRKCQLSKEQSEHYKNLVKFMMTYVSGEKVEVAIILTQMLRLAQITSGYIQPEGSEIIDFKDNPKLELLMETLDELSGKTIIWVKFKHDIDIIIKRMNPCEYVIFSGDLTSEERQETIKQFHDDDKVRYFITTSAGGYGLNMAFASNIVYYSHEFSIEKRSQSEDRCHRIGQEKSVTIIDLEADKTIDTYVLKCIKEKRSFTDGIMDNIGIILKEIT